MDSSNICRECGDLNIKLVCSECGNVEELRLSILTSGAVISCSECGKLVVETRGCIYGR